MNIQVYKNLISNIVCVICDDIIKCGRLTLKDMHISNCNNIFVDNAILFKYDLQI